MTNQIQEIAIDHIIDCLSDHDQAIEFVTDLGVFNPLECFSVEKQDLSDDRKSITLSLMSEYEAKHLVADVKTGPPSIDQIHSLLYRHGANSDIRIIFYADGNGSSVSNIPSHSVEIVRSLVNSMNQYNKNIYLIRLISFNPWTKELDYNYIARPPENCKLKNDGFPSEKKFREAEFWRFYFACLESGSYDPTAAFEDDISNDSEFGYQIDTPFARINVEWNDSGMFYHAASNEEYPNFMLDFISSPFAQTILNEVSVGLRLKPNKPSELIMKVGNFPLNRLIFATWNERLAYAMMLRANVYKIQDLIEDFGEDKGISVSRHNQD